MALGNWNPTELEELGRGLEDAANKIRNVAQRMRIEGMDSMVLSASTIFTQYAPAIFRLAGTIDAEFNDQLSAARSGRNARWQINQTKIAKRKKVHAKKKVTTPRVETPAASAPAGRKRS